MKQPMVPSPVILVVDDNAAARYVTGRLLRQAGYEVVEAGTGADGERLAQTRPDLVVLDIKLPDIDGFEVCRRIKNSPATAGIPIIHLTATYASSGHWAAALDSGADAYLTQPVEPVVLVATVRAMLRTRAIEAENREAARHWQATFNSITDGVALLDRGGLIRRCNRALSALLRVPEDALVGRSLVAWPGAREPEAGWPFQRAIRTGRRETAEIRTGSRWFQVTCDPVMDEHGELTGAVDIVSDITQRIRTQHALFEAARRKDEFLATLAHELRNPLAPIQHSLEILDRVGSDDERAAWSRGVIRRQTAQLTRLVDDLLDISRVSQGKINLRKERTDLDTIVTRAIETVRPMITAHDHDLQVERAPEPVSLWADPGRLEQVFGNLLHNAAKYTPHGGRIRVATAQEDGRAIVRVTDNGVGIRPELLGTVFDLFTQLDGKEPRSEGGLGIGLTLVRRIVELHGGTVEAESAGPGLGSQFTVRIPVVPPPEEVASASASGTIEVVRPGRRRIMVVDDNVDAAESLGMVLEMFGHDVRISTDPHVALGSISEFEPDLMFLDIGMPGMNGLELARRIRDEHGAAIRLIALTGYGREQDRAQATDAGFDHYLVKPATPDEVQGALAAVVSAE